MIDEIRDLRKSFWVWGSVADELKGDGETLQWEHWSVEELHQTWPAGKMQTVNKEIVKFEDAEAVGLYIRH